MSVRPVGFPMIDSSSAPSSRLVRLWREYGVILLGYLALAVLLSWPTARDFTTAFTSSGGDDARLNIWTLWHTRQALFGAEPLLAAPNLYYPVGVSLLTHSPGPLMGLLALPFWPLGPEAAYNATLILGLTLTGFCMYPLARALAFSRGVAFFSGSVLMTAPMVLGGLLQHVDKVFLGLIPLALLAALYAVDPWRSRWWTAGPGVILLLTMFQGGWHFIVAGLGVGYILVMALLVGDPAWRDVVWRRAALVVLALAVLVGPMLYATALASANSGVHINRNLQSKEFHPDLAQLVMPSPYSRLFPTDVDALGARGIKVDVENAIGLAWTGLALAALGLLAAGRRSWPWALLLGLCILLALGSNLRVMGRAQFTEFNLPIVLPYAFFTALPGMDFMRTSGRFMFLGFTAGAVLAGYGLAWLTTRLPHLATPLVALAVGLLLVEVWPNPWPQDTLRLTPAFYQQIAADTESYGVFDLPHRLRSDDLGISYSSHYQIYQMTHRKGIHSGYVSFAYEQHPVFPCLFSWDPTPPDLLVDGSKVSCYANAPYQLAQNGYRYLVQHKPQRIYSNYKPGSRGDGIARDFVAEGFSDQTPIVDDDLTTVYEVPRIIEPSALKTSIEFRGGWDQREDTQRWARSPAMLYTISPTARRAILRLTPAALHDPTAANGVGDHGRLTVTQAGTAQTFDVRVDQPLDVPIDLQPGGQVITLALESGNFRPVDYGVPDPRTLSFAIRAIDMLTVGR